MKNITLIFVLILGLMTTTIAAPSGNTVPQIATEVQAADIIHRVDTIAALRQLAGNPGRKAVQVMGYYVAGDGGGGPVRSWDAASTCTDDGATCIDPVAAGAGRWVWDYRGTVNVRWFGAKGDGIADDLIPLQTALNQNRPSEIPPGRYRITAALLVDPALNRNTGFLGTSPTRYPSLQQTGGPPWDGLQEPTIFYDGPISTSAAVIAASAESVGIEPVASFATTIWGFTLRDIALDANGRAGFCLYAARVQDIQLFHVAARGATVAGFSVNGTYSGSIRSCRAALNPGRGFELGAADDRWGWTRQDNNNATYIYDLHADANGSDSTFREADPVLRKNNCGVYFGPHRGVMITGIVSENNFGANIVYEPTDRGSSIHGIYTELGCKYAPAGVGSDAISLGYATQQWGLIYVGSAGAVHNRIADGVISIDRIWLTGTEPTPAREEGALELYNISLSRGITAEWGAYRLINCALELENGITGVQPVGAFTVKGGLQFGVGKTNLTHYSEGVFLPTLAGATFPGTGWAYTVNAGSWTRIGQQVFVSGRIQLSAKSTDATGQIVIANLPYAVKNGNNYYAPAAVNATSMTVSIVNMLGSARINTPTISLSKRTAASTTYSPVVLTDLSATTIIDFSASYVTADN